MHLCIHGGQNDRSAFLITLPHSCGVGPLTELRVLTVLLGWQPAKPLDPAALTCLSPGVTGVCVCGGTTSAIYVCAGICTVVLGIAQQVQ